ncbi:FtsW/RodA/SpoVE family cell cycle protein [Salinispora arenicola]|uniref:Probable peptidoglycan glycosyltransferase FtsW n=1 Tax=Salinispora arenicola TaxID=168697 RepID=A0A542XPR1_SALAC|nr:putative peptidoglycan glycosyltransferase FtsW [Salinispora arenicola]MCN0151412.1 putative lipid II flippase FtsW [Salinispora arenicola]TQL37792.1 cell division-specific peptidoglycan biosynthesis regulator FtsW [Salinispora arenicola]GIM86159.1 cell division protein FtsW [Salinispora arenicola]
MGAGPPKESGGPQLRGLGAGGGLAALRGLLARPLASYYLLLSSSGLLLLIGLTMVFSATSVLDFATGGNATESLTKQAIFAVIGVVAFWVCQRLPVRTFRGVAWPALGVALVLLLLLNSLTVLQSLAGIDGIGPIRANLHWLHLGPVQLQPSEVAKFALVLWGADVIARKGAKLGWWRELATPLFPVVGLLFVLVGYGDLGTMLCLLALVVGLLWAAGVRLRVFATLTAIGLLGVGLLVAVASLGAGAGERGAENYRLLRLTMFIDPPPLDKCKLEDCHQMVQARYAIENGGWFGTGLGKGSLKWGELPAAENDFIFAVIAEELGVVGCGVVVVLFAVLAYTGLRIAGRMTDPFRRLAAASATAWLTGQAMINIGGVLGLLPLTGVPLPFISDGGSALVVTLAAIGMLASFARAEPDAARALHARPPARWVRLVWAPLPPLPSRRRPGAPSASRARAPEGRHGDDQTAPRAVRANRARRGSAKERRR